MKNNFNPVAWCYDELSWIVFGNKLKQSQRVLLDHVQDGAKILILGGGTGWMLHELLKTKKVDKVDYLEASEKMLYKTKERIPSEYHACINFIHGQEDQIPEHTYYDCVITCYFFDLFSGERQKKIIALITNSLKEEGRLLVADFNLSFSSPLFHKVLMKTMYLFFRMVSNIEASTLEPFRLILREQFLNSLPVASTMNGFILSETYCKKKK
jgi:ubiquinone/menaquinone biosynthesis C-methylase UbiE